MAHGSSASAIAEAVRAIMMAKIVDHLHGHPNTEKVDHLEDQLAKACAAVRTTAWKGQHGCLPLALSDAALNRATKGVITSSDLPLPDRINKNITESTSTFEQLSLKVDQDVLWIEWWTKIACNDVGVDIIVASADAQYLEELEEDFTGYSHCSIRDLLDHLRTSWCKIQNQEKIDAKAALRKPWADTPDRHITKYTRELTRSANAAIAIDVPCPDDEKVVIFVENMYASSHFTETELVTWENQRATAQKWTPTVKYFTKLYADRLAFQTETQGISRTRVRRD
jgi:hypothetical protein